MGVDDFDEVKISLTSWNCGGICSNESALVALAELNFDILCIQETKLSVISERQTVGCFEWPPKFSVLLSSNPLGYGGLAVLVKKSRKFVIEEVKVVWPSVLSDLLESGSNRNNINFDNSSLDIHASISDESSSDEEKASQPDSRCFHSPAFEVLLVKVSDLLGKGCCIYVANIYWRPNAMNNSKLALPFFDAIRNACGNDPLLICGDFNGGVSQSGGALKHGLGNGSNPKGVVAVLNRSMEELRRFESDKVAEFVASMCPFSIIWDLVSSTDSPTFFSHHFDGSLLDLCFISESALGMVNCCKRSVFSASSFQRVIDLLPVRHHCPIGVALSWECDGTVDYFRGSEVVRKGFKRLTPALCRFLKEGISNDSSAKEMKWYNTLLEMNDQLKVLLPPNSLSVEQAAILLNEICSTALSGFGLEKRVGIAKETTFVDAVPSSLIYKVKKLRGQLISAFKSNNEASIQKLTPLLKEARFNVSSFRRNRWNELLTNLSQDIEVSKITDSVKLYWKIKEHFEKGPTRLQAPSSLIVDQFAEILKSVASPGDINSELLQEFEARMTAADSFSSLDEERNSHPLLACLLRDISHDDVSFALLSISEWACAGVDGICIGHLRALCNASSVFLQSLTVIFNKILLSSTFPNLWKLGMVIPIPKGAGISSASHLRPITLLVIFGKVFGKIFNERLHSFVNSSGAFNVALCGFRRNLGAQECSFLVKRLIEKGSANGKRCFGINIDWSKAFDHTLHQGVMLSLLRIGCGPTFTRLVGSMLKGRTSFVWTPGYVSSAISWGCSVPQGDVLSPFFFNLDIVSLTSCLDFVNELLASPCGSVSLSDISRSIYPNAHGDIVPFEFKAIAEDDLIKSLGWNDSDDSIKGLKIGIKLPYVHSKRSSCNLALSSVFFSPSDFSSFPFNCPNNLSNFRHDLLLETDGASTPARPNQFNVAVEGFLKAGIGGVIGCFEVIDGFACMSNPLVDFFSPIPLRIALNALGVFSTALKEVEGSTSWGVPMYSAPAEFVAINVGLSFLLFGGVTNCSVHVHSDSKFVIDCLSLGCSCPLELRGLRDLCIYLMRKLKDCGVQLNLVHRRREFLVRADANSKLGADGRSSHSDFIQPMLSWMLLFCASSRAHGLVDCASFPEFVLGGVYADDLTLVLSSMDELRIALRVCYVFSCSHNYIINIIKSFIAMFGGFSALSTLPCISVDGSLGFCLCLQNPNSSVRECVASCPESECGLRVVGGKSRISFRHLGSFLIAGPCSRSFNARRLIRPASHFASFEVLMSRLVSRRNGSWPLPVSHALRFLIVVILPKLIFGLVVANPTDIDVSQFERTFHRILRGASGGQLLPSAVLRAELGFPSFFMLLILEQLSLFRRLLNCNSSPFFQAVTLGILKDDCSRIGSLWKQHLEVANLQRLNALFGMDSNKSICYYSLRNNNRQIISSDKLIEILDSQQGADCLCRGYLRKGLINRIRMVSERELSHRLSGLPPLRVSADSDLVNSLDLIEARAWFVQFNDKRAFYKPSERLLLRAASDDANAAKMAQLAIDVKGVGRHWLRAAWVYSFGGFASPAILAARVCCLRKFWSLNLEDRGKFAACPLCDDIDDYDKGCAEHIYLRCESLSDVRSRFGIDEFLLSSSSSSIAVVARRMRLLLLHVIPLKSEVALLRSTRLSSPVARPSFCASISKLAIDSSDSNYREQQRNWTIYASEYLYACYKKWSFAWRVIAKN